MSLERQIGIPPALPSKPILPPDITETDIRNQLDRVRASQPFRSSKRCLVFLDFVVHAALDGHPDGLKERTIGVEVFNRNPNYDTNQDPVVRGTASEVRKRLAQYYQEPGRERELRINLPAGSYLPEFHWPLETTALKPPEVTAAATKAHASWLAVAAVIVAAAVVLALFLTRATRKSQTVVDALWAPVLQSPEPVLLCIGQPKVYNLLGSFNAEMDRRIPGPDYKMSPAEADESITFRLGDIAPSWDRYIALGDAECLSDIVAVLAQRRHQYHIRGGGSTSFADLRESPSVLIGAFNNDWTMRLTGQLRFTFERTDNLTVHFVQDRLHPSNRQWRLGNVWPDWKMPFDYAIVSRVLDPTTGKMVITAAGITHFGTAAAGEFLTKPEYLSQLERQAPRDWQRKNLQVVLATRIIGGTAGPPEILATQFW